MILTWLNPKFSSTFLVFPHCSINSTASIFGLSVNPGCLYRVSDDFWISSLHEFIREQITVLLETYLMIRMNCSTINHVRPSYSSTFNFQYFWRRVQETYNKGYRTPHTTVSIYQDRKALPIYHVLRRLTNRHKNVHLRYPLIPTRYIWILHLKVVSFAQQIQLKLLVLWKAALLALPLQDKIFLVCFPV